MPSFPPVLLPFHSAFHFAKCTRQLPTAFLLSRKPVFTVVERLAHSNTIIYQHTGNTISLEPWVFITAHIYPANIEIIQRRVVCPPSRDDVQFCKH